MSDFQTNGVVRFTPNFVLVFVLSYNVIPAFYFYTAEVALIFELVSCLAVREGLMSWKNNESVWEKRMYKTHYLFGDENIKLEYKKFFNKLTKLKRIAKKYFAEELDKNQSSPQKNVGNT